MPAGSSPVARNAFLAPNGDLYIGNTVTATSITSAALRFLGDDSSVIGYVQSPTC